MLIGCLLSKQPSLVQDLGSSQCLALSFVATDNKLGHEDKGKKRRADSTRLLITN